MELSDKQVILKIKNGEINYYSYIVQRYTASIYRYVGGRIKKKEDVEDIVQESFIKFYKAINNFEESKKIFPYLLEIAKNELKMFYRSRKIVLPLNEEIAADEKTEQTFDEISLKKLSEKEKRLVLEIGAGYTYEETARKFKTPVNTVKSIVRRARVKLRVKNLR